MNINSIESSLWSSEWYAEAALAELTFNPTGGASIRLGVQSGSQIFYFYPLDKNSSVRWHSIRIVGSYKAQTK